jgi:hypothetical protein
VRVRAATAEDLPRILALDAAHSGFARARILTHVLGRAPPLAHVAERGNCSLVGYALGRDGHAAMHIGPVVAEDDAIGLALVSRAMAATPERVILDVPDRHRAITAWLGHTGATAPRGFTRMLRGPCPVVEDAARVFALAGPELA